MAAEIIYLQIIEKEHSKLSSPIPLHTINFLNKVYGKLFGLIFRDSLLSMVCYDHLLVLFNCSILFLDS